MVEGRKRVLLIAGQYPPARKLAQFEGGKRVLTPFIPRIDLDKANLHPREVPWYFHLVSKDFEAITRGDDIYFRPDVYDPTTIEGLAKLGHELVHVRQYRNGLTWAKYVWASRHSYDKNPYEKPA